MRKWSALCVIVFALILLYGCRNSVQSQPKKTVDLPELRITVSIGGVYAAGQISELVEKADLALYRAKAQKDSAVLYEEDFHDSE